MTGEKFTIERSDLFRALGAGPQTFSTNDDPIVAEWLDERGESLGDAEQEAIVFPPFEWPGEDRSIMAAAREPLITSRHAPPAGVQSIRFSRGPRSATFATESGVAPWVTEHRTSPFGGGPAEYEIPVFSEFFTDAARFEAKVGEFHAVLSSIDPFSQVQAAGRLRVVGYYARSTVPGGNFGTIIKTKDGERRIYGDQGRARGRLATMLPNMPMLILIDSTEAGGAGGMLHNGLPYWPAWASLGSMSGRAGWEEVAVHELAHGFGLSDEYIDRRMATLNNKPPRYDNVSSSLRASALTWNDLARLPDATALPTHRDDGASIDARGGGALAAYQGAYYSDESWRPSLHCRMRDYHPGGFCGVCSRTILALFGMPDG